MHCVQTCPAATDFDAVTAEPSTDVAKPVTTAKPSCRRSLFQVYICGHVYLWMGKLYISRRLLMSILEIVILFQLKLVIFVWVQNSHQSVDVNGEHEPVIDQSSCPQPIFQVMSSYIYSYVVA